MQERQVTIEGVTHAARAAVPRARDAEPDRVRGHLPAARGAARPLPAPHRRRLPGPRGRVADARAPPRACGTDEIELYAGRRPRRRCSRCSGRWRASTSPRASASTCVDLVAATRDEPRVQVGASPRGSLALLKLSRCRAAVAGRDFVTPDDVKAVAVPALGHRLMLRPSSGCSVCGPTTSFAESLDTVPTPRAEDVVPVVD